MVAVFLQIKQAFSITQYPEPHAGKVLGQRAEVGSSKRAVPVVGVIFAMAATALLLPTGKAGPDRVGVCHAYFFHFISIKAFFLQLLRRNSLQAMVRPSSTLSCCLLEKIVSWKRNQPISFFNFARIITCVLTEVISLAKSSSDFSFICLLQKLIQRRRGCLSRTAVPRGDHRAFFAFWEIALPYFGLSQVPHGYSLLHSIFAFILHSYIEIW